MLLNGGSLDDMQILSPAMIRLMTSNQLGAGIKNDVGNVEPHRSGYGFGLGVAVRVEMARPRARQHWRIHLEWRLRHRFFCRPQGAPLGVFGTAAPGELRKYYREQVQDLVYGAITR